MEDEIVDRFPRHSSGRQRLLTVGGILLMAKLKIPAPFIDTKCFFASRESGL